MCLKCGVPHEMIDPEDLREINMVLFQQWLSILGNMGVQCDTWALAQVTDIDTNEPVGDGKSYNLVHVITENEDDYTVVDLLYFGASETERSTLLHALLSTTINVARAVAHQVTRTIQDGEENLINGLTEMLKGYPDGTHSG